MAANNGESCDGKNGALQDNKNNIEDDDDARMIRAQSIDLRKGLEELMEHIQRHRHEESSESLEERYLLLVSSYHQECLGMAVTLTDADIAEHESSLYSSSVSPPKVASEATLRLPIHLAYDKDAPLSIIKSLLNADVRKNGEHPSIHRTDKWGDLPIHIACSRASATLSESDRQLYGFELQSEIDPITQMLHDLAINDNETVESIRILLEADKNKTTLSIKDVYESLPLHTAARYNASPEVISLLLEKSHSGLYTEGFHGQFPLTVACRSGSPRPEVLRLLLEYDDDASVSVSANGSGDHDSQPSTILHKDTTGRLPIHVFMLRNTCEACLRILLRAMFGTSRSCTNRHNLFHGLPSRNSIISIGLDAWKRLWLSEVIPAMDGKNLYERDFTTRDKLDLICTEARLVCEVCWSLELVTWKMSYLSGLGSADEGHSKGHTNARTIVSEDVIWKQSRRIVSGAEIIVPNVLSFLEDEPVERIVEKFRSYGYLGGNVHTSAKKV